MPEAAYQPKEIPENKKRLNRVALKFLKKAGTPPVVYQKPDQLYAMQLAVWGMMEAKIPVQEEVENTAFMLLQAKDKAAVMKYLEQIRPGEMNDLTAGAETPEDLAGNILDQIEDRLVVRIGLDKMGPRREVTDD